MGHRLNTLATDYESVRTQLINILRDYNLIRDFNKSSVGVTVIEMLSYVTELLNFYINEAKTEMSVEFAQRRDSLLELARAAGYTHYFGAPARGEAIITYSVPLSAGQKVMIPQYTYLQSRQGVNYMTIEPYESSTGDSSGTTLRLRQGIIRRYPLGTSNGAKFQKFKVPSKFVTVPKKTDVYIAEPVLYVEVEPPGGATEYYSFKESLILSEATDTDFTASLDEENYTYVHFGDGLFGKIPPVGSSIKIVYEEHVGAAGNIDGIDMVQFNTNQIATYNNTITLEALSISATTFINARDPDDEEDIRNRLNDFQRMQNRTITKDDFVTTFAAHKGVIRASATTFSDIYSIVSRLYTISGNPNDVSIFLASGSVYDISAYYDSPWQYFTYTDPNPSAMKYWGSGTGDLSANITGFAIGSNELWAVIAAGGNLTKWPDYSEKNKLSVNASAISASVSGDDKQGYWLNSLQWTNDIAAACAIGHTGGAISASQEQALTDWMDYIAPPPLNINVLYKQPRWVFTNINFNVERDPTYYGSNDTIINNIATVLWEKYGFDSRDRNTYILDFGSKLYLGEIEQDIANNVPGIKAINIPGSPDKVLKTSADAITGTAISGTALAMWTPCLSSDDTGTSSRADMSAVWAAEYYGNNVTGTPSAYTSLPNSGMPIYTSAYFAFWNPEERSITYKRNQVPIVLLSGVNFT